jgi:hypothetical protein
MEQKEALKNARNKKIAIIIGAIVFVWYVVSIFTVWHQ